MGEGDSGEKLTLEEIKSKYKKKKIEERTLVEEISKVLKEKSNEEFEIIYWETKAILRKHEEWLLFYRQVDEMITKLLGGSGLGLVFVIINNKNNIISNLFSEVAVYFGFAVLIILLIECVFKLFWYLPILFKNRERIYYQVLFDILADMRMDKASRDSIYGEVEN
ncbi:hypothetical protein [Brotaphodocola sp.]|uniref:hypothetical protein n=1 Tax=Brotaphodocola sp. TaxID=3073577 RepID=UPI003D7D0901